MPKSLTLLLALVLPCCAVMARSAEPAGAIPHLANGKPDLSGHWNNPYAPDMAAKGKVLDPKTRQPLEMSRAPIPDAKGSAAGSGARTVDLPYTEWGLKHWKSYDPVNDGDYAGSCL